ncbi:MAG: hypothetical protein B7Z80_17170, partial [Rhodospirillales bacterium 20-64-7]
SQERRQKETTKYEISKTMRAVVHDQPRIERISLAVMIDGIDAVTADGKHNWRPRSADELDRIDKLVKTAIGYDEKRGDHVEVVSMPFINEVEPSDGTTHTVAIARNADLVTLLRIVGFGVVGFGIIILTARSILNALNRPPSAVVAESSGEGGSAILGLAQPEGGPLGIGQDRTADGPGGGDDRETIQMKQVEGAMRASSIRKVTELAESQPENALAIIRRWMAVEQG